MAKSKLNIGQIKYGQLFDKLIGRGKTTAQAHKIASSPLMKIPDKFDKPSAGDKIILALLKKAKKKKPN